MSFCCKSTIVTPSIVIPGTVIHVALGHIKHFRSTIDGCPILPINVGCGFAHFIVPSTLTVGTHCITIKNRKCKSKSKRRCLHGQFLNVAPTINGIPIFLPPNGNGNGGVGVGVGVGQQGPPIVTSFEPRSVFVNNSVTVLGSGLLQVANLTINGVELIRFRQAGNFLIFQVPDHPNIRYGSNPVTITTRFGSVTFVIFVLTY